MSGAGIGSQPVHMTPEGPVEGQLVELRRDECLALLRQAVVGRIGLVVDDFAVIVPVGFRTVGDGDDVAIAIRTRSGSAADHAATATFEVDAVDGYHHEGWSVLVRARVEHHLDEAGPALPEAHLVSWVAGRDRWLVLRPVTISGRRLRAADVELPSLGAYL